MHAAMKRIDDRQVLTTLTAFAGAAVLVLLLCSGAHAFDQRDRDKYASAIDYCRTKPGQKTINAEKNIVCYDGPTVRDEDISFVRELRDFGLFVVRSEGGDVVDAIEIARVLAKKHEDVVVYDYCNSACAQFLIVASDRTYVSRNSIVALHFPTSTDGYACAAMTVGPDGLGQLATTPCPWADPKFKLTFSLLVRSAEAFLRSRTKGSAESVSTTVSGGYAPESSGINPHPDLSFNPPPQSAYVQAVMRARFEKTGALPQVAWTWNPRYAKAALKTDLEYEAYPESQDQLDAIAKRVLLRAAGDIIYDP